MACLRLYSDEKKYFRAKKNNFIKYSLYRTTSTVAPIYITGCFYVASLKRKGSDFTCDISVIMSESMLSTSTEWHNTNYKTFQPFFAWLKVLLLRSLWYFQSHRPTSKPWKHFCFWKLFKRGLYKNVCIFYYIKIYII